MYVCMYIIRIILDCLFNPHCSQLFMTILWQSWYMTKLYMSVIFHKCRAVICELSNNVSCYHVYGIHHNKWTKNRFKLSIIFLA